MKKRFQNINLFYNYKTLLGLIIGFGIILRLSQYLYNRSLWLDEAGLVVEIIHRPFLGLLKHSNPWQTAPIGFSIVEKILIRVLSDSEYVLRLFPLICGIISLFLFYKIAKCYLEKKAVLIAVGLFAISDRLIYYSSEAKQYSSDVFIALLLVYAIIVYFNSRKATDFQITWLGTIGAAAIWFSHTAIFILAGAGTALALFFLIKKDWPRFIQAVLICTVWIFSFILHYYFSLRYLNDEGLIAFWWNHFMPFPPKTFSDLKWIANNLFEIFVDRSLRLSYVAQSLFFIGCISMFLRKRDFFFIITLPILIAMMASGFHKYPFYGRLLLFYFPFAILLIAEGVWRIKISISNNYAIIGTVLIILLFFQPILIAGYNLIKPRKSEEIRQVFNYFIKYREEGDFLYLCKGSWPSFSYYLESHGLGKINCISGVDYSDHKERLLEDLNKIRGEKRVWIIYSDVLACDRLFLDQVRYMGKRLDSFEAYKAAAYLYDMSK